MTHQMSTWYMSLKGLLVDTCLTLLAACLVTEDIRYFADIILNTDKLWKNSRRKLTLNVHMFLSFK